MKKNLFILLAMLVSFVASAQPKSILTKKYTIVPPCAGVRMIPFVDEETEKIGFVINASGLPIAIEPIFDDVYNDYIPLCGGMYNVQKGDKWGVVDQDKCRQVIPCIYDSIGQWRERDGVLCALVSYGGKTFYIDRQGKKIR